MSPSLLKNRSNGFSSLQPTGKAAPLVEGVSLHELNSSFFSLVGLWEGLGESCLRRNCFCRWFFGR